MPVVQRYGAPKVATAALPSVQKTAAETPLSEGAGLAEAQGQAWDQAGRLAGTVGAIATQQIDEATKQADSLVVLAAENKAAKKQDDIWTRAQAVKGNNALALPDSTAKEWNAAADEIQSTLANDRQREAFAKTRSRLDLGLSVDVHRHLNQEMQAFHRDEFQSSMNLGVKAITDHALDPNIRGHEELQHLLDTLHEQGSALGMGPQELADRSAELKSVVHVNAVTALLDDNQTSRARMWFDEAKGEIDVARRGPLEKLLNHGSALAEGQHASDAIIAKGGTLTEQLAATKDLSPDAREHAESRIKQAHAVAKEEASETTEGHLKDAYALVTAGQFDKISPSMQYDLATHMPALRTYALALAKGEPPETDLPTYYALKTMASDPETRAAFLHENLLAHRTKLSKADFDNLTNMQVSMRNGDQEKADKINQPFMTHRELVDSTLEQHGIPADPKKPTTDELNTKAQLYRRLDQMTEELQGGGKRITHKELQDEIDRTIERKVYKVTSGLTGDSVTERHLAGLTMADIPDVAKAALAAALRMRNRPVTDAAMLDLYIANRMKMGR